MDATTHTGEALVPRPGVEGRLLDLIYYYCSADICRLLCRHGNINICCCCCDRAAMLGSNQYYCRLERHKQWYSSGKQAISNHYLVATLMLLPLCRLSVVPLVDMDDDVYLPLKMAPAMTVPSLPRPPPLLPLSTQT